MIQFTDLNRLYLIIVRGDEWQDKRVIYLDCWLGGWYVYFPVTALAYTKKAWGSVTNIIYGQFMLYLMCLWEIHKSLYRKQFNILFYSRVVTYGLEIFGKQAPKEIMP